MKQFDSYIVYGCHFPEKSIKLITSHSSLNYFNNKIKTQYNCEILELEVPLYNKYTKNKYFLSIIIDKSNQTILKLDKLEQISLKGYTTLLKMFDLTKIDPYLISVPVVRNLPE